MKEGIQFEEGSKYGFGVVTFLYILAIILGTAGKGAYEQSNRIPQNAAPRIAATQLSKIDNSIEINELTSADLPYDLLLRLAAIGQNDPVLLENIQMLLDIRNSCIEELGRNPYPEREFELHTTINNTTDLLRRFVNRYES